MSVTYLKTEPVKSGGYDLSPKQVQALSLIVSGVSHKDVASEVNCNVWTISNWVNHDQKFQRAIKAETDKLLDAARQKIAASADRAVEKLITTVDSQAPSANTTKAAQILLDRAGIVATTEDGTAVGGLNPTVAALMTMFRDERLQAQKDNDNG